MTQIFEADRALLEASLRRHDAWLPLSATICLSAAIDALTDPLSLPSLAPVEPEGTEDVRGVIRQVRARLARTARRSADAESVLLAGHAMRELDGAARALEAASADGGTSRSAGGRPRSSCS